MQCPRMIVKTARGHLVKGLLVGAGGGGAAGGLLGGLFGKKIDEEGNENSLLKRVGTGALIGAGTGAGLNLGYKALNALKAYRRLRLPKMPSFSHRRPLIIDA